MDRFDLEALLSRAGLREYEVPGVHELGWRPPEYPYLRLEEDGWVVGICERGRHTTTRTFTTEDAACRFFHELLTGTPPPDLH
jgi:hypothetical protein